MQSPESTARDRSEEAEALAQLERELEQGAAQPEPDGSPRPCWSDAFAASGGKGPVW